MSSENTYDQWGTKNHQYKHGLKGTRIYNIWRGMKQRCFSPTKMVDKLNYADKGITVCKEWLDISVFNLWAIENGYKDNLTLDRIDNDGNYEPSNCRWVTHQINSRNRGLTRVSDKYLGVNKLKNGKFKSNVKINGKQIHLGTFNTEKEALNARNNYIIINQLTGFKIQ